MYIIGQFAMPFCDTGDHSGMPVSQVIRRIIMRHNGYTTLALYASDNWLIQACLFRFWRFLCRSCVHKHYATLTMLCDDSAIDVIFFGMVIAGNTFRNYATTCNAMRSI